MKTQQTRMTTAVIVDATPDDYAAIASDKSNDALEWRFVTRGGAALREAHGSGVGLWMINVCLPDMSGLDLLEMLSPGLGGTPVFVIADEYHTQHERDALRLGATKFFCKPVSATWLAGLQGLPAARRAPLSGTLHALSATRVNDEPTSHHLSDDT